MTKKKFDLGDIPEVMAYLNRINATDIRSLRAAYKKIQRGSYWEDVDRIYLQPSGEITCRLAENMPTEEEAKAIKKAAKDADWPKWKPMERPPGELPYVASQASKPQDEVFVFYDRDGKYIQHQTRVWDEERNDKRYITETYWSDGWRIAQPPGSLPLFNIEKIKKTSATTVFIHEGAKAAQRMQRLVEGEMVDFGDGELRVLDDHPWKEEVSNGAVHLGFLGGALNPNFTDWKQLRDMGVKNIYIVPDNDNQGSSVIRPIAKRCMIKANHIFWSADFPPAFDMGDWFPKKFFKRDAEMGIIRYTGPSFEESLEPCTWASEPFMLPGSKKVLYRMTEAFLDDWFFVEDVSLFVHKRFPHKKKTVDAFNREMKRWSDAPGNIAEKFIKEYKSDPVRMGFFPGFYGQTKSSSVGKKLNLWRPTKVKETNMSVQPFMDFLEYMFPMEDDRKEIIRWLATIIGRPDISVNYGLLLASERQGIGKSTLCDNVLAPLVHPNHYGQVTEKTITDGNFNDWQAEKVVVVCHEIYAGRTRKAYDNLKSVITEPTVRVNQKYREEYTIENHMTVVACSNSLVPLSMDDKDRRWLMPTLPEELWGKENFGKFFSWLKVGGLGAILRWARNFDDYIQPGEHAPMTSAKKNLIEASKTQSQLDAESLCQMYFDEGKFLAVGDLKRYFRTKKGHKWFNQTEMNKALEIAELEKWPEILKIRKRRETVWGPRSMVRELWAKVEEEKVKIDDARARVRALCVSSEVMDTETDLNPL